MFVTKPAAFPTVFLLTFRSKRILTGALVNLAQAQRNHLDIVSVQLTEFLIQVKVSFCNLEASLVAS